MWQTACHAQTSALLCELAKLPHHGPEPFKLQLDHVTNSLPCSDFSPTAQVNLIPDRPGLCMNTLTYSVCRDFLDFILHHFIFLFYLSVHDKLQKCRLIFVKTFVNHVLWGMCKHTRRRRRRNSLRKRVMKQMLSRTHSVKLTDAMSFQLHAVYKKPYFFLPQTHDFWYSFVLWWYLGLFIQ